MIDGINHEALLKAAGRIGRIDPSVTGAGETKIGEPSFQDALVNLITEVDQAQKAADVSLKTLAAGDSTSIQDVVMKLEQADLSFLLMKQVRDKLLQAYKEVMSM